MPNIDLTCIECKKSFYFNERDQGFYKAQGFQPPRRCFTCRQARKPTTTAQPGVAAPKPLSSYHDVDNAVDNADFWNK